MFNITGEVLTNIARTLWADDQQPEKAQRLLRQALPDMDEGDVLSILTGSKKLVGNTKGMLLEPDQTIKTSLGNSLTIDKIMKRFRDKSDEDEDVLQFHRGETRRIASRHGLVEIPNRRVAELESGKTQLEDFLYRKVETNWDWGIPKQEYKYGPETEPEPEPELPPKPEYQISTDDGWLSPDGKYYRCPWMGHIRLAERLGFEDVKLEEFGWVKISKGEYLFSKKITQTQRDLVFDWCKKRNMKLPRWIGEDDE